jgi:hypothetical protein
MIYFVLIATGIILACMIIVLAARTILSISLQNTRVRISWTTVGCGLGYDNDGHRVSLLYGRRSLSLGSVSLGSLLRMELKHQKPAKGRPKSKIRPQMPLIILIRIGKAWVLFVARFLSRVQYDVGKLRLRPVIANPAMAGMAYGWSQALQGVFPGLKDIAEFEPKYCTGSGHVSGQVEFSIKNRQTVALLWRFLGDLPIKEIIKYRFSKKR